MPGRDHGRRLTRRRLIVQRPICRTVVQNPDIGATVAAEPYAPEGASPLSVLSTLPIPSDLPALQKALDAADPERRLLPLGLLTG